MTKFTKFIEEPWAYEMVWQLRRFFLGRLGARVRKNIIYFSCMVYAALLGVLILNNIRDINSYGQFMATLWTLALFFALPVQLHNSISGERERRTWDLLIVAPITVKEIVRSKFLAGFSTLVLVNILSLLLFLASLDWSSVLAAIGAMEILYAQTGFGLFTVCLSLWISSRVRSSLGAQTTIFGTLLCILLIGPLLLSMATGSNLITNGFFLVFNYTVADQSSLYAPYYQFKAADVQARFLVSTTLYYVAALVLYKLTVATVTSQTGKEEHA